MINPVPVFRVPRRRSSRQVHCAPDERRQRHDLADHQRAWQLVLHCQVGQAVQASSPGVCRRVAGAKDDRGRRRSGPARREQPVRHGRPRRQSHQHDDGGGVRRDAVEHIGIGGFVVARHDDNPGRDTAMRHRNACKRGRRERRRDARHDFHGNPGSLEGKHFFPASSEDEGIAALQPHHALTARGRANHQPVDGLLRHRVTTGALSDIEAPRAPREIDDRRRHQRVVQHQIGAAQQVKPASRQQARIAWTRADESDSRVHAFASCDCSTLVVQPIDRRQQERSAFCDGNLPLAPGLRARSPKPRAMPRRHRAAAFRDLREEGPPGPVPARLSRLPASRLSCARTPPR